MATTMKINLQDDSAEGFRDLAAEIDASAASSKELEKDLARLQGRDAALSEQVARLSKQHSAFGAALETTANALVVFDHVAPLVVKTTEAVISGTVAVTQYAAKVEGTTAAHLAEGVAVRALIGHLTGLGTGVGAAYLSYKSFTGILSATGKGFEETALATESTRKAFRQVQDEARNLGISVQQHLAASGKSIEEFGVKSSSNLTRESAAWGRFGSEIAKPFKDVGEWALGFHPVIQAVKDLGKSLDQQITMGSKNAVQNVDLLSSGLRNLRGSIIGAMESNTTAGKQARDRYLEELDLMDKQAAASKRIAEQAERNAGGYAAIREMNKAREQAAELENRLAGYSAKSAESMTAEQKAAHGLAQEEKEIADLRYKAQQAAAKHLNDGTFETKKDGPAGYDQEHAKILDIIAQRERKLIADRAAALAHDHDAAMKRIAEEDKARLDVYYKEMKRINDRFEKRAELAKKLDEQMETFRTRESFSPMISATHGAAEHVGDEISQVKQLADIRKQAGADAVTVDRETAAKITDLRKQQVELRKREIRLETDQEVALAKDILEQRRAEYEGIRKLRQIDLDEVKRAQKEQLDVEVQTARERAQKVSQLSQQYSGGMKLGDAQQQAVQSEQQAQQQILKIRQQATQAYMTGDVKGFFSLQQQETEILQQFLEQQQQLREKFKKEGNPLDQLKAQFTDKEKLGQIAENRTDAGFQGLVNKNKEGFQAYQDRLKYGESGVDDDTNRQANKFRAQFEKMQKDIQKQVNREFNDGKIGDDAMKEATSELTDKTIDFAQKQGKVTAEQAEAMKNAAQVQQQTIDQLQQVQEDAANLKDAYNDMMQQLKDNAADARARAMKH